MDELVMFCKATHLNSELGVLSYVPGHIRGGGCKVKWNTWKLCGIFSEKLAQVAVISLNTDSDAIICCKQVEVAVKMYDECGDCMCHYFKFTLVVIDIVNQNFCSTTYLYCTCKLLHISSTLRLKYCYLKKNVASCYF